MKIQPVILVVDDKEANLVAMRSVLGALDAGLTLAASGEDALRAVLRQEFALAILDVQMPGMDGYELASLLRADPRTKNLPIIFVSAVLTDDFHVFKGYSSGAVDFITKPFHPDVLLSKARIFLELHLASQELKARSEELAQALAEQERVNQELTAEIAGRRLAEQSLQAANDRLEGEIAQRTQAQERLAQAQAHVAGILDSMPSVLVGVDQGMKVTDWNAAAEAATGLDRNQALGLYLEKAYPELSVRLECILESLESHRTVRLERQPVSGGAETGYRDIVVFPLAGPGQAGAVIRVDDVTERVRLEERMIQSEKMISVGGLAAGMAHEINNPLGAMLQSAQVIQNRLDPAREVNRKAAEECGCPMDTITAYLDKRDIPEFLASIREAGNRAARIVTNMLEFSKSSRARREELQLADVLDRSLELAASDYDLKKKYGFGRIGIVREYGSEPLRVACNRTEIEQVFLNLLRNAVQALHDGTAQGAAPVIIIRAYASGDQAVIEVEDNGPGMEESVRNRVFEPFFSTRETGEGTGLGLTVAYFIVTQFHGGTIQADSIPGRGSRFTIKLPMGTA